MCSSATLMLSVWREACRHIEIHQSTVKIETLLESSLMLEGLVICRLDKDFRSCETVAHQMPIERSQDWTTRILFSAVEWKRLNRWGKKCKADFIAARKLADVNQDDVFRQESTSTMVAPLHHGDHFVGLVFLLSRHPQRFTNEHLHLAQQLIEPLGVALENDSRLHELKALREAAEADRRTLLSRLGRQDVNEAIIGSETGLKSVMERIDLVSTSDVPVLILGETGTGKEVAARAIHARSKRQANPFIRVNCGAIPTELIDSQLFGHEKGSFTGASDQRKGWFERAEGGTLFLDEIGELPLAAQVRLLRVLQDHHIERVGGQQSIHVDVRIVAATHRDLTQMVKHKQFREDLWYRINVFPILLPPLKERIDDIPALVRSFSKRAANRFQLKPVEASPADLALLINYSWPGNIRELGAVIDRAVILGNGKSLEIAKALGLSRPLNVINQTDEPTFYEVIPEDTRTFDKKRSSDEPLPSLDTVMKNHIERALVITKGKVEGKFGAASLLGINPHTLRARMRKHSIDWTRFRDDQKNEHF